MTTMSALVGCSFSKHLILLARLLELLVVDQQARIVGSHFARLRIGLRKPLQILGGLGSGLALLQDLGVEQRAELPVRPEPSASLISALATSYLPAAEGRLRHGEVRFGQLRIALGKLLGDVEHRVAVGMLGRAANSTA